MLTQSLNPSSSYENERLFSFANPKSLRLHRNFQTVDPSKSEGIQFIPLFSLLLFVTFFFSWYGFESRIQNPDSELTFSQFLFFLFWKCPCRFLLIISVFEWNYAENRKIRSRAGVWGMFLPWNREKYWVLGFFVLFCFFILIFVLGVRLYVPQIAFFCFNACVERLVNVYNFSFRF